MKINDLYTNLIALFMLLLPDVIYAQDEYCTQNTHDPINFGYDSSDQLRKVVETPDGKSVVFGSSYYISGNTYHIALARYLANGMPDTTFSGDGRVGYLYNQRITCYSGDVDDNNKIYTAGYQAPGNGISSFKACLTRFLENGQIDTTFGNNGVTSPIPNFRFYIDVHVYPDSSIVAIGRTHNNKIAMAKYTYDGTLDTGFNSTGYAEYSHVNLGLQTTNSSVVFTEDGYIYLIAKAIVGSATRPLIVKWNQDGTLDTNFGGFGSVTLSEVIPYNFRKITASYNQNTQKLLVAANNTFYNRFLLWRLTSDGSLDSTFADNGILESSLVSNGFSYGVLEHPETGNIIQYGASNSKPAFMQCDSNGVIIPSCSGDTITSLNFGYTYYHEIRAAYFNSNNDLLIFGVTGLQEPGGVSDQDANFYHFNNLCFLNPESEYDMDVNLCPGESIEIGGVMYTESGVYTDTLLTMQGCDSITTYTVEVEEIDTTIDHSGNMLTSNQTGATYQWLTCPDYMPVANETNSAFMPTENGEYALEITYNGCVDTSGCMVVQGIGMDDYMIKDVRIHQNPVREILTLDFMNIERIKAIEIYDVTGKKYYQEVTPTNKTVFINTAQFPNGLYTLCIQTDTRIQTFKIVKL